ncbi:MAG: L,D-transpeptidase family protein [Actinomycetota bacterium]|nr:L,D-transpeptidase family protein [Actinomycetota bacterium]
MSHSRTVVRATGPSTATVSFFARSDEGQPFAELFTETHARIGWAGCAGGDARVQGSGTTPTGTWTMTQAFGTSPDPGSLLPYRQVAQGDRWVGDPTSDFYNDLRSELDGGFDSTLPADHPNASERLTDFPGLYDHVIVVDFNRPPDRRLPGRGAAIFVHVRGDGPTAGCVGVSREAMRTMLAHVHPSDTITISG